MCPVLVLRARNCVSSLNVFLSVYNFSICFVFHSRDATSRQLTSQRYDDAAF